MSTIDQLISGVHYLDGNLHWVDQTIPIASHFTSEEECIQHIQNQLYNNWYIYGKIYQPGHTFEKTEDLNQTYDSILSKVSPTVNWQRGWTFVKQLSDRRIKLQNDGICVFVDQQEARRLSNTEYAVKAPLSYHHRSPGFNIPFLPHAPKDQMARIYLSLTQKGAYLLLRNIDKLRSARLPLQCKVANLASQFQRSDAAVIYMNEEDLEDMLPLLQSIISCVAPELKDSTPAMTKRIQRGVALAQDPGNGKSFGQHRCGLVAKALVLANSADPVVIKKVMGNVFKEAQSSLEHPWCSNSSTLLSIDFKCLNKQWVLPKVSPAVQTEKYRQVEKCLFHLLLKSTIYTKDGCNWLGSLSKQGGQVPHGKYGPILCQTLDTSYYSGLTGVGSFLAAYYQIYGDERAKKLGEQALTTALSLVKHTEKVEGYYHGYIGDVCALIRTGQQLELPEVVEKAVKKLTQTPVLPSPLESKDLLGGVAGSIAALCSVYEVLTQNDLVHLLAYRVFDLKNSSESFEEGIGWKSGMKSKRDWLSGFSHGLSGIAYALARYYSFVQESWLIDLIASALKLEDSSFCHRNQNWEDLRIIGDTDSQQKFMHAWCHGFPGILLARSKIKAWTGISPSSIVQEFTSSLITKLSAFSPMDFSLCHGQMGLAEISWLITGDHSLKDQVLHKINTYTQLQDVPQGVLPLWSPSMMLGMGGIAICSMTANNKNHLIQFHPLIP